MRITLIDHAHDEADSYEVTSLAKEKGALRIGTPQFVFFIDSFQEFAESVVELVGREELPEPEPPSQRLSSLEDVLSLLAREQRSPR
jgi:hypothetical protein